MSSLTGYPRFQFALREAIGGPVFRVHVDLTEAPGAVELRPLIGGLIAEAGLSESDAASADWIVRFETGNPSGLPTNTHMAWQSAADHQERYAIHTHSDSGQTVTRLWAVAPRGVLYALRSALQWTASPDAARHALTGTVVDYPMTDVRGVIEGFYGRPYGTEKRRALLHLMSVVRENIYIYGPKNDPYTRHRWRRSYQDPDAAAYATALADVAAAARERMIRFVWAISPGGDFQFNDPDADFRRVLERLAEVRALGVAEFALFLDDVPFDFGQHARAHAELANRLQRELGTRMYFVGTTYHGAPLLGGPNAYTDLLGELLNDAIDVFWTGKDVYSPPMSDADLARINVSIQRRVTIWDNWPDIKTALFWRPGPVQRGSDTLHRATAGFLSNPTMNEFGIHPPQAFWKVLGPLADYLWNPTAYEATRSYAEWEEYSLDPSRESTG